MTQSQMAPLVLTILFFILKTSIPGQASFTFFRIKDIKKGRMKNKLATMLVLVTPVLVQDAGTTLPLRGDNIPERKYFIEWDFWPIYFLVCDDWFENNFDSKEKCLYHNTDDQINCDEDYAVGDQFYVLIFN